MPGNRDKLVQVFLNLVKNAAEAIGEERVDGQITLSTSFRPGVRLSVPGSQARVSLPLEIAVEDNGAGVSPELMPHLFDPFVTTKQSGTGLGLALVAKIVGDHGGIIECDSRPRQTVFRALMPMCRRRDWAGRAGVTMAKGNILIADDDAAIRTVLNQALARAGYAPRATGNAATLWRWISQGEGDLVITDVLMPDESAFDLIPRVKKLRPDLPIIVMSAQNTFMTAITAAERGAYEYLPKPFDLNELVAVVGRALAEPRRRAQRLTAEPSEGLPLIGRCPAMQDIYRVLARLTQTDLTVMITGEFGTGKELVARALHDYGKRRNGPFVAINMAAIPRELIESELFGHEKGAFTGAQTRHVGRFEQAEGGTLFLDEIGDMPMEAQTRLLRVLQEGEYTTVGGRTPIRTNVRIIAATNRDLQQQIDQGLFREDLFYRLNVVPLRLPPLRERLEDIPDLVRHFLAIAEKEGLPSKTFEPAAIERLKRYHWPGNVRELENLVRRLSAIYSQDTVTGEMVDNELASAARAPFPDAAEPASDLSEAIERYLSDYFMSFGQELPPSGLYTRLLRKVEFPLITAALAATRGNQIRAADLLGLNRNTLRKKIRDLGIKVMRTAAP